MSGLGNLTHRHCQPILAPLAAFMRSHGEKLIEAADRLEKP